MSDEIRETKVEQFPGWTKIDNKNTRSIKYRSPDGVIISRPKFEKLAEQYSITGRIPYEELVPNKGAAAYSAAFSTGAPSRPTNPGPEHTDGSVEPSEEEEPILDLPDAKVKSTKTTGGRASAKDISDSLQITLLIATSIVSLLADADELAMTDDEAKAISIPAANLLASSALNQRIGKLIASSGDWQLLIYALFLYMDRVVRTVRKRNASNTQAPVRPATSENSGGITGNGAVNGNVPAGVVGTGGHSNNGSFPYNSSGGGRPSPIVRNR